MESKIFPPGTDNLEPGTYVEVTIFGDELDDARIIEIEVGDRLPPTQSIGRAWLRIED